MPDVVTLGETMALFAPREAGPLRYVTDFRLKFGGAETNFATALVRLGLSAGWISRLGDDALGRLIAHHLGGEGLDLSRLIVDPEAPTGLYVKELSAVGESTVYYYRRGSAASRLSPDDVDAGYIREARWLHVTGITPALSESCRATVEHAIELARSAGVSVSFDPNLRLKLWTVERAREVLLPIMERCTVLLGGAEELARLLRVERPAEAADWALERGLELVAVKLGREGALVATADERRIVPAYVVPAVVDAIGAGDGFDAGLVAGRLKGWDAWRSAELANAVGAHALMVQGDYEGYPTLEEAEAFMAGRARVTR
jgi:2-dehydro-3-deoxygluconokinase